jgi:formylglycine-generating enzyme required for sulfatase activity
MNKENNINDLFRQAREQQPQASFNETKNLFLNALESQKVSLSDAKKGKIFTFKNSIIMSAIIGFIALIFSVYFTDKSVNTIKTITKIERTNEKELQNVQNKIKKEEKSQVAKQKTSEKNTKSDLNTKTKGPIFPDYDPFEEMTKSFIKPYSHIDPFKNKSIDEYVFPKLTEEEIKKTKKQKKKMLKALAKMDRDYFSYIPSGTFVYKGTPTSVQAFFMQKTEVSNLEYRTFLFDLLIQNRKEEFLKAKPNQKKWVEILGESYYPIETMYFSDEGYDDYPVNNISREGAELYCKWLTNELINFVGEEKGKRINDFRLPTRQEWVKAASVEGLHKDYAFEGELYNAKLNFYVANFNLHNYQGTIKKGYENQIKDSLFPSSRTYGYKHSVGPWKINVTKNNKYGLYNMSGNVAEMVIDGARIINSETKIDTSKHNFPPEKKLFHYINEKNIVVTDTVLPKHKPILIPGTAGGGWMNSAEEIKINAPDNHPNFVEAHPNIGFRVVMTHIGRGGYYLK